jgi:hypothetical protein
MGALMGSRRSPPSSFRVLLPLAVVLLLSAPSGADDEKAAKQLEKLDAQFVKALTELAKSYDEKKVPEAAHFFASCALGFGGKDEKLAALKGAWEGSVYLGILRGGEPLQETAPITGALGSISTSYKKLLDPWISRARKGDLPGETRKLMFESAVKTELSRNAQEYVKANQRFNALRKAMGLRAILWDFEESRKLILSGLYTCETEDWQLKELKTDSSFFNDSAEAGKSAARGANKLSELPERLRSFAFVRQHLLNPNARTLRLGFWGGGSQIDYWSLYSIPQLPYRPDIPTPTERFRGETVVKDWVDVEETVDLGGKKVPISRYPYPGEAGLPAWFSNGKGYLEDGWSKSEIPLLSRAGLPIMFRWFIEATPSEVKATLRDPDGALVPCRVYSNHDERVNLGDLATVLILPEAQLGGMREYRISIQYALEGHPLSVSWTFKTGEK